MLDKKATININVQVSLLWKIEFFGYIFRSIVAEPYGKGGGITKVIRGREEAKECREGMSSGDERSEMRVEETKTKYIRECQIFYAKSIIFN